MQSCIPLWGTALFFLSMLKYFSLLLAEFIRKKATYIAKDKEDRDVYLAESRWMLQTAQTDYPELAFHFTSEF